MHRGQVQIFDPRLSRNTSRNTSQAKLVLVSPEKPKVIDLPRESRKLGNRRSAGSNRGIAEWPSVLRKNLPVECLNLAVQLVKLNLQRRSRAPAGLAGIVAAGSENLERRFEPKETH